MKPDYWVGYHEFGQYCYRRGDHETAAEQFRKVVALNPGNAYGHLNLGTVLWALGRPDEAAAMFRRSLAAEPNYRAYNNLSIVLYMQHQYAEAAAACEQALVLNDTSYRTWATLGNASYWLPGRREAALEAFARAAALAEQQRQFTPRDAWLLTSLAGYYAILGQGDRARPLIAEALQIAPADARVAYFAGHAYEQLGDREQALAWIDQALQNGYSRSDVQNDPFLEELRRDRRFR
jgi:tetratricopeptide (TPR) repeat protein